MYLGIQLLAGLPELEIASFANTFRCFDVPGNPGFARIPGARNRDFREEIPPFWGAGKSNFWRLPRASSRILMVRDLCDAAGQPYPRIERCVSGPPVRQIGAFRTKFHRFLVRKWRILADSPDSELATPHQR